MPSRCAKPIYNMLSEEPVTPDEIANRLGVNHKTTKDALMHLAATTKDVRYKNSGRIHLFWRKSYEWAGASAARNDS